MLNLIKYEIRGKLLTLLGICLTVITGNLLLMTKMGSWGMGVPVLSAFLGIGSLIVMFISSLTLMSDYLYDDQGYLLFTLPQSGLSIMVSRLITALIQMIIVTIVSLLMFSLIDQRGVLKGILYNVEIYEILYSILMYLWIIVSTLTFIYFCMVVGKVALKGKKVGKIGSFIIFLLLGAVKNGLTFIVSAHLWWIVQLDSATTMNIGSTIIEMITFAIFLMATSYLLEHKVDL